MATEERFMCCSVCGKKSALTEDNSDSLVGDIDLLEKDTVGWFFRNEPKDTPASVQRRKDFCSLACAGAEGAKPWADLCAEMQVVFAAYMGMPRHHPGDLGK